MRWKSKKTNQKVIAIKEELVGNGFWMAQRKWRFKLVDLS